MHVLLIEDNKVNVILATRLLERFNCTVSSFPWGSDALAYLADRKSPRPHLMIIKASHLGIPNGHDTARILRTQAPFIHDALLQLTPIIGTIILRPGVNPYPENHTFMNDFLPKPVKKTAIHWVLLTWARRDPLALKAKL
ncbi:hypothetical protein BJX66DRAFT_278003 [Aspergillus keveii]|uniref:Response regulatory domain-containing protein n=1 Tax=Aspergillus keveii TaxID=714993 RepID=A0ABR4GL30_9EURO